MVFSEHRSCWLPDCVPKSCDEVARDGNRPKHHVAYESADEGREVRTQNEKRPMRLVFLSGHRLIQHVARPTPDGEEHGQRTHASEETNSRRPIPPLKGRNGAKDEKVEDLACVSRPGSVLLQSTGKPKGHERPSEAQRPADGDCFPRREVLDEEPNSFLDEPVHLISFLAQHEVHREPAVCPIRFNAGLCLGLQNLN